MRNYSELTARNLLRPPLVLGAPASGMVALVSTTLGLDLWLERTLPNQVVLLAGAVIAYVALRVFQDRVKPGWAEPALWFLERTASLFRKASGDLKVRGANLTLSPPDTLTDQEHLDLKEGLHDRLKSLKPLQRLTFLYTVDHTGTEVEEILSNEFTTTDSRGVRALDRSGYPDRSHVYSLYALPVRTDPMWLPQLMTRLPKPIQMIASFQGLPTKEVKSRVEHSRKKTSRTNSTLSSIDSKVTFEETSQVLESLSRGEEKMLKGSLLILSPHDPSEELDEQLFCWERFQTLAVESAIGARKRFYRSHWLRIATATDLIPTSVDPKENAHQTVLQSVRGNPLEFSPVDSRLESLHWLVSGATGTGKSFFTGLVLKRLIDRGEGITVFVIDHRRSFMRLVTSKGGIYVAPKSLSDLTEGLSSMATDWVTPGSFSGLELSDLPLTHWKEAIETALGEIERHLKTRESKHPFYVVLDECWSLMRNAPFKVEEAFREYRKLGGAVIAVTQSLGDLLSSDNGQSIYQNAPIRILLRQGEDMARHQGVLGLNPVETAKVQRLRQVRGVFSECLIRTPYLSRIGRLYPTHEEFQLLCTDPFRPTGVQS